MFGKGMPMRSPMMGGKGQLDKEALLRAAQRKLAGKHKEPDADQKNPKFNDHDADNKK